MKKFIALILIGLSQIPEAAEPTELQLREWRMTTSNLNAEKLPEAFFCNASSCAQCLYRYLYDLGLVPGKDISVFSFRGAKNAEMMTPPLATAINVGLKEMVKSVVSEYVHHKKTSRMMFRLTQQAYYKGNLLVPFRQKNGKDLSIEQNIRCGEEGKN